MMLPDPAVLALGAVVEETSPKHTSTSGTRWRQRHKGGHLISPVIEGWDRVNLVGGDNLVDYVHFHESNSGHVVYTADNRGVVARWQVCNDR